MSNHLRIALHTSPKISPEWTAEEVVDVRWLERYPARTAALCAKKPAAIVENPELITEYRSRLTNLSWRMKSLCEPIACTCDLRALNRVLDNHYTKPRPTP
jgi:hypothetical protein